MARMADGGGGGGAPRPAPRKTAKKSSAFSGFGKAVSGIARSTQRTGRNVGNYARNNNGGSSRRSSRSNAGGNSGGRNTYSSGYRNSGAARPSSGSSASGVVAPTIKAPVIPKFDQAYLAGDTAYSAQRSAFQKALADYAAQYGNEVKQYGTEYNSTLGKLKDEQGVGATNLQDDFASRGLLTSGVYADALNDFNSDYDTKRADLARAKAAYETDLSTAKGNFTTEQQLLLDKAKQDALNRYNDRYKS